jgi:hypothetical protein
MYGVVTRNVEEMEWSAFDRGFYEVKDVTGKAAQPVAEAVNVLSCFADNAAVSEEGSLVAVDSEGRSASEDRSSFDWTYVCPTNSDYREGLLEIVADCVEEHDDVRLDNVEYPGAGFCHCDRCDQRFAESNIEDREAWRASVITEFVAEVAALVPGRLFLSLRPDPYPGHLYERSGVDLAALDDYVDEFVVPLYDPSYATTYWLETIASGFGDELDTSLGVELYAVDQEIDDLIDATAAVEPDADHVYFGYDSSTAAAAIRRRQADQRGGVSHGPGPD